jgi:hypothetical protein
MPARVEIDTTADLFTGISSRLSRNKNCVLLIFKQPEWRDIDRITVSNSLSAVQKPAWPCADEPAKSHVGVDAIHLTTYQRIDETNCSTSPRSRYSGGTADLLVEEYKASNSQ